MKWVISQNVCNERNYTQLVASLERMDIPFINVQVVPFWNKLIADDVDLNQCDVTDVPELVIDNSEPLFPYGTLSLCAIAEQYNWKPGVITNSMFDTVVWYHKLGSELLNGTNKTTCAVHDLVDKPELLEQYSGDVFIRPRYDNKTFNGTVLPVSHLKRWSESLYTITDENGGSLQEGLNRNTQMMIAPFRKIYNEIRFFVVDGKIVTYSQYKLGSEVVSSPLVHPSAVEYAQDRINQWQPASSFVMDIALTSEGYRVVEYNTINCSGLYACDANKIVQAIHEFYS